MSTDWYVKAARAQTSSDHETWKRGGVCPTLNDFDNGTESRATVLAIFRANQHGTYAEGVGPLTARYGKDGKEGLVTSVSGEVTHALTSEGHDASEDGTGRGTPVIAFGHTQGLDPQASELHTPTLRKEGGGAGVLQSNLDTSRYDAGYADATQARSREALRALWEAHGEEAAGEWLAGVAAALRAPEILRPEMHGVSVRREAERISGLDDDSLSRAQDDSEGAVRDVRCPGCVGRPSPGHGSHEQLAGQLGEILPLLSHEGPSREAALRGLRESAEGSRLLRQALSAVEEVGRPADREGQPALRAAQSGLGGVGVSQVRRLTPRLRECERLQGFPDDWTACGADGSPMADSSRYRMMGNAVAVPVVEWLVGRLVRVDAEESHDAY